MELTIFACQKLLNLSHFMWFSLILWKDSGLCGHNIESRNNDSEGPHLCVRACVLGVQWEAVVARPHPPSAFLVICLDSQSYLA